MVTRTASNGASGTHPPPDRVRGLLAERYGDLSGERVPVPDRPANAHDGPTAEWLFEQDLWRRAGWLEAIALDSAAHRRVVTETDLAKECDADPGE